MRGAWSQKFIEFAVIRRVFPHLKTPAYGLAG